MDENSQHDQTHAQEAISYAQCWEDADVLLEGLDVAPGDSCVSIASAGDNTLALLSRSPARVIAVDHNPVQLFCLELRIAAYRSLNHAELLELIGSRESDQRATLYQKCRLALSRDARRFWDSHDLAIKLGFGSIGKFERYFALFRTRVLPFLFTKNEIASVLESRDASHREQFYNRHVNKFRYRIAFRIFFSRFVMQRIGRDLASFRYVQGDIAHPIRERVRHALTELDPSENAYLQWILTGRHLYALPYALRPEHFDTIRNNLDRIEIRCEEIEQTMKEIGDSEIERFNLSDVFEYMPESRADALFEDIARVGRSDGRVAYWNMRVTRSRPEHLSEKLIPMAEYAQRLHLRDKAFFYKSFQLDRVI